MDISDATKILRRIPPPLFGRCASGKLPRWRVYIPRHYGDVYGARN
jgi:hypothetical protein